MTSFAMPTPNPLVGALLSVAAARRGTVELTDSSLVVTLGPAWRADVPRGSITAVARDPRTTVSIGAHGWRGRWLVNTVGHDLVSLTIDPPARARCLGVPVSLRRLTVSVEDPDALVRALS